MTAPDPATSVEQVVLLDDDGAAIGTMEKAAAHHRDTPLHLAFSCYVFDQAGRILMTRRAVTKRVFPGVLTNSCCGHPGAGEAMTDAVARRLREELGLAVDASALRLVLPAFAYRAEMDGIVEHEMCPVYVAVIDADAQVAPNPVEVGDVEWRDWTTLATAVANGTLDVSPWCALQVRALTTLGHDPLGWPVADPALLPPAAREPRQR